MNLIQMIITSILCLCVSIWTHAEPSEQSPVKSLIKHLASLQSLAGDFSQTQVDSEGELLGESSGTFAMQRPGLLRWQTHEPFAQLLISNNETLWLYDPDLEQVSVSPVGDQIERTPAVIFSGNLQRIQALFEVTKNTTENPSIDSYSLQPRNQGAFQRLDLFFSKQGLSAMRLLDGFGQQTDFVFSNTQQGPTLSVEEFHFVPPAGTDVLIHE